MATSRPTLHSGHPCRYKYRKSRSKAYEALPGNQHCAQYISSVAPKSAVAFAIGTDGAVIVRRLKKGRANRDFSSPPQWAMIRSCGASSGRFIPELWTIPGRDYCLRTSQFATGKRVACSPSMLRPDMSASLTSLLFHLLSIIIYFVLFWAKTKYKKGLCPWRMLAPMLGQLSSCGRCARGMHHVPPSRMSPRR